MALSDKAIKNASPRAKPFKLADSGGLFLLVGPSGTRFWRLKYRFAGKEKQLSLGAFPAVSLTGARRLRDDAKAVLAHGQDPSALRKAERAARVSDLPTTRKNTTAVRLVLGLDGSTEIHKGRAAVRLSADEAKALQGMLAKLQAGD